MSAYRVLVLVVLSRWWPLCERGVWTWKLRTRVMTADVGVGGTKRCNRRRKLVVVTWVSFERTKKENEERKKEGKKVRRWAGKFVSSESESESESASAELEATKYYSVLIAPPPPPASSLAPR
jgi:hypothetical protein